MNTHEILPKIGRFYMTEIRGRYQLVKVIEESAAGYLVCTLSCNGNDLDVLSELKSASALYPFANGETDTDE